MPVNKKTKSDTRLSNDTEITIVQFIHCEIYYNAFCISQDNNVSEPEHHAVAQRTPPLVAMTSMIVSKTTGRKIG